MTLSILKGIRRRSKATFGASTDTESQETHAISPSQSSSTLSLTAGENAPPRPTKSSPVSNLHSLSTGISAIPPSRPTTAVLLANDKYSLSGMAGLGSPMPNSTLPSSQYAPHILSIVDGTWVYQKVLSIYGKAGGDGKGIDGNLNITRLDDCFPPTVWPVSESHFKALLYLMPGPNKFRFDFRSPRVANSNSSNNIHSSYITLHMIPPLAVPPLQLVILLGKDSPGEFDAVPAKVENEGNGLETAIRKFRMAAYLWQAFTSEQMHRNKLGRRVFRVEEEWMTGTSSCRDRDTATMRSESKVHVVRCSKTVAELRAPDLAQQNPQGQRKGELFSIALEAVKDYFKPEVGQKQYVCVLLLDAHWDKAANFITGHAALGGGVGEIKLAIFGSHALQSYPCSFEEITSAFSDCTPTDTNYVANDCSESGSNWEAANIGIGAHLHEVGHLFGCPHQESGIMLREYVTFNRSFMTREPYSTRTRSKGGLVLPHDECSWHRLDCLRFRSHLCFSIPTDLPRHADDSVQAWPVENGLLLTAASGIAYLEIYTSGDELCHQWQEFGDGNGRGPIQKQVVGHQSPNIPNRLPDDKKKLTMKLKIYSLAGGTTEVDNFSLLISKSSRLKLSNGKTAFRSCKLGLSQMEGSRPVEIIFDSAVQHSKLLTHVRVYHGFALDGIEFIYEDSTSQIFGKPGGQPGGSEYSLDTRRGETISAFYVRSGFWIDGIQIITSLGRKSALFGNAQGGSGHTLCPPRGYSIAGITGSCATWVDGFGIILMR